MSRRGWMRKGSYGFATVLVLALMSLIVSVAFAATVTRTMTAGDTWNVVCPTAMSGGLTGQKTAKLVCAPNPTTTTTQPSTTTTGQVTTTTQPTTTTTVGSTTTTAAPPPGGCALATPAFCDTFDAPAGIGNRSGDLNGTVWGASHTTGDQNFSSPANGWFSAPGVCGHATAFPPTDITICGGQLHDTVNDGGNVTALAMYPKQPFDFAGRTGKIVFDVSNDSQGNHAAWPELWITDQPVPAPFAHESTLQSNPRNGLGIRFAGCSSGSCPRGSGTVGVDSAITVTNYVENDSFSGGSLSVTTLDSVTESGPGQMNHYEVDVTQGQVDIYATDAFTPGSTVPVLRHIATIPSANLPLTRGLVWIEDAHYNGDKFNSQGTHTFRWDNVGFDGPRLPRDLTFDVPDHSGGDLGYFISPNSSVTLTVHGVTGIGNASGAALLFGYYDQQSAAFPLTYKVNGHAYPSVTSPVVLWGSPKTLAVPVALADLVAGDNTVTFSTGGFGLTVMNVDILLIGAGG